MICLIQRARTYVFEKMHRFLGFSKFILSICFFFLKERFLGLYSVHSPPMQDTYKLSTLYLLLSVKPSRKCSYKGLIWVKISGLLPHCYFSIWESLYQLIFAYWWTDLCFLLGHLCWGNKGRSCFVSRTCTFFHCCWRGYFLLQIYFSQFKYIWIHSRKLKNSFCWWSWQSIVMLDLIISICLVAEVIPYLPW